MNEFIWFIIITAGATIAGLYQRKKRIERENKKREQNIQDMAKAIELGNKQGR